MKGGSVSVVCKGYITKVVWRAILALSGAWGPRELVILDNESYLPAIVLQHLVQPTVQP